MQHCAHIYNQGYIFLKLTIELSMLALCPPHGNDEAEYVRSQNLNKGPKKCFLQVHNGVPTNMISSTEEKGRLVTSP